MNTAPPTIFRFAPSPNGALHLGHAYSALVNFQLAQEIGGRFLLRMEDIDIARCSEAWEDQIYEDLSWLGIKWEMPVRRQSDHFEDYQTALDSLISEDLVYPGFLSRGDVRRIVAAKEETGVIWPRDPDGAPLYPDIDRLRPKAERQALLAEGERHTWRLDMAAAQKYTGKPIEWIEFGDQNSENIADPGKWGDVVLARSDTPTSYHLAVVVDDALQGVTHVVRGRDLYDATSVHRLLQEILGLAPPHYHHHQLITDDAGFKLSKSNQDTSIKSLREAGCTPGDIGRMVGIDGL